MNASPTLATKDVAPINVKSRLAPAPDAPPRWSVPVQNASGEKLAAADPRATRAMVALMDMNALHGGAASHYGGPAAFAELMSAAHALMFHAAKKAGVAWNEAFHFVNDAGHCENGLYALKANYGMAGVTVDALKKFRSIESPLTGHGEAHLFPEGVLISNGPLGSSLPQAQGLAMADAATGRKRVTICALSDGAAMEGEAKEALAAIPGLARRGGVAPFVLVVSDNRTKLSGRIDQDAFSMEPTFRSLETLGWRVFRLEDGHHLQGCVATLEEAIQQATLDPSTPIAIHARTIKGKGSKKAEASATGAHGFPLKAAAELPAFLSEIYDGSAVPPEFLAWAEELQAAEQKKAAEKAAKAASAGSAPAALPSEKIQLGVAAAMIARRKAGAPVVSISADLQGSTGVADFHKAFPEAAFDVGVAESNMISAAVGFSLGGFVPFVDTFAQFGVTKGALPITMANLSHAPVIGVFSHTGFQDAADGASHQALSYFAQVGSIPHVETYALTCSSEAEALVSQAIDSFVVARKAGQTPPTRIFFLGRENFPRRFAAEGVEYKLGRAQIVLDAASDPKRSVAIAAAGSMLGEAMKAAQALQAKGVGVVVVNPSIVNKPDLETFERALAKTGGRLVTVEEHRPQGGMGATLIHALATSAAGRELRARTLTIGDAFGQSAYSAGELYKRHGLDASAIQAAAESLL